jgi:hypothetical protein
MALRIRGRGQKRAVRREEGDGDGDGEEDEDEDEDEKEDEGRKGGQFLSESLYESRCCNDRCLILRSVVIVGFDLHWELIQYDLILYVECLV